MRVSGRHSLNRCRSLGKSQRIDAFHHHAFHDSIRIRAGIMAWRPRYRSIRYRVW